MAIAALVAIALSRYGISDPTLWRSSAAVSLALWVALVVAVNRGPASRALARSPEPVDRLVPVVGLPLQIIGFGSLLVIVLGIRPGIDAALYVTAPTTGVVYAGCLLLALVFSQQPTSD